MKLCALMFDSRCGRSRMARLTKMKSNSAIRTMGLANSSSVREAIVGFEADTNNYFVDAPPPSGSPIKRRHSSVPLDRKMVL